MITFRSHYSFLRTLILIIENVLSSGFHQKAANHNQTGSNAFRTLVVTRFGGVYNWPQYQTDFFNIFALSFFFALLRIISIKNNYFHYL